MKQPSNVVQHLRTFAVVPTYLGRYTQELVEGKIAPVRAMVRDGWKTGETVHSRDGKSKYVVAPAGNLVLLRS